MDYPATTATVEVLPNGLTLILDADPTAPVVSAQIWVATGSMHEDHLLGSGVSHFLEHMVFKGTRDLDGDQLAGVVQAAGGHWNAYTSFDRTVYYIDGPAASLEVFLHCLTGLVFFPRLPEAEFANEQDVIRREIDMGLDDPDQTATRLLLATAFQQDPRRHPVIGHRHRFDALCHADLVAYHRARYTTDRCTLVISGDFDPAHARRSVGELTAACLQGCGRDPFVASDPPQLGPRRARETFAIPASRLTLAWKIPALDHPDAPAFEILAAILGRGRSSRLYRHLRDELALALEISAFCWTDPGRDGLFAISAESQPAHRDTLVTAITRELEKIQTGRFAPEVAKAQRQLLASQLRQLATASGRAADLGSNWHVARDVDFTRRQLAALAAVTEADVQRVARQLVAERLTLSVLDPLGVEPPAGLVKAVRTRDDVRVEILGNGMVVGLVRDARVPLVYLQAAVRAGLPSEDAATNGLNQLLAAVLPKGTATRTADELAVTLESLGASIGAATGNNALVVQASGLAADFATIADVFCEVLVAPRLADDAIAREKASQLAALEEAALDPMHAGFRALRQAVFGAAGYGLDALGTAASLIAMERAALVAHHARHFTAANTTVVIAGDFEPATAVDVLTAKLAAMPGAGAWQPPAGVLHEGADLTVRLAKKQAVLTIGFAGATVSDPDRHPLAMIQEYVSDMAGPLFGRIREELGLAYQVGATQFLGYDSGLFSFYLATAPEQVELARRELLEEIAKVAAAGIPEDAFERVRSTVLSGLAIQQQSPSQVARHVALDLLYGHPADEYRRLTAIYQAITPGEVRAVAQRVFARPPTIATVLPESPVAPDPAG